MPMLKNILLSGIGPRSARFNNIIIPCLDPDNPKEVSDTLLWLRNGGGKTTLLSLLFAIFRPALNEYLGMLTKEKRHFRDVVSARGVAIAATEWTVPGAGDLFGGHEKTRVVGYAAAWPNGEVKADASPKRLLFSFLASPGMSLQNLPVRGRPEWAQTLDQFRRWLEAKLKDRPHADAFIADAQGEQRDWEKFLTDRDFDVRGFYTQIKMNLTEGGASKEILSFADDRHFLEMLFEVIVDGQRVSALQEVLAELRGTIQLKPQYELEKRMLDQLKPRVESLHTQVENRTLAAASLGEVRLRAGRYLSETTTQVIHLKARVVEAAGKETTSREDVKNVQDQIDHLEAQANWAHLRHLEENLTSARAAHAAAEVKNQGAQRRLRLAEGVAAFREMDRAKAVVDGLREQIAALDKPRAQLRLKVLEAAGVLGAVALVQHASAAEQQARTQAELSTVDADRSETDAKVNALRTEAGRFEARIADLGELIRQGDDALSRLVVAGLVLPGEDAEDALNRLEAAVEEAVGACESLAAKVEEIRRAEQSLTAQMAEARVGVQIAESRLVLVRGEMDGFENRLAEITGNAELALEEEVDSVDPYGIGLFSRLKNRVLTLDTRRNHLRESLNAASRDAAAIDDNDGLLPMSEDIQAVLVHLRANGVSSAYSYPEYLLLQGWALSDIAASLTADPARYGGIVLLGRSGMPKAEHALSSLDRRLRAAVQITMVEADELPAMGSRAVLLPEAATYDKDAAAELLSHLRAAIKRDEEDIHDLSGRIDRLGGWQHLIQAFLRDYPEGSRSLLTQRLEQAQADHDAAEDLVRELAAKVEATAASLEQARRAEVEGRELLRQRQADAGKMNSFWLEHGKKMAASRDDQQSFKGRLAEARQAIADHEGRLLELAARITELESSFNGRSSHLKGLATDLAMIRDEWGVEPAQTVTLSLDAAREQFRSIKDTYDKEKGPEHLEGQLEQATKSLTGASDNWAATLRRCAPHVSEVEIRQAFATGEVADMEVIERLQQEAVAASNYAAMAGQSVLTAKTALADWEDKGGPISPIPDIHGDGRAFLQLETTKRHEIECQQAVLIQKQASIDNALRDLRKLTEELNTVENAISSACLFLGVSAEDIAPAAISPPFRAPENHRLALRDLKAALDESKEQLALAEGAVTTAVGKVMAVVNDEEFLGVASHIKEKIRESEATLPECTLRFLDECGSKIGALTAMLGNIEKDKKRLVQLLDYEMNDIRLNLDKLEEFSRIPQGVGDWSGRTFFEVTIRADVRNSEYRHAHLDLFLEDMLTQREMPQATQLVFLAAHKIFDETVKITAFKPGLGFPTLRYPVVEILKGSGGEKLTAAVLIYMTLVRLGNRGRSRGSDGQLLILDNPVGSCNLADFIEVQRRVAAACRIQLLVTTGVNDLGAVGMFPRIVAINNRHVDSDQNMHLTIEQDDARLMAIAEMKLAERRRATTPLGQLEGIAE